nr:MAG TPA_asm: hypothetical protein [Inoviridae sp.]
MQLLKNNKKLIMPKIDERKKYSKLPFISQNIKLKVNII